MANTNNPNGFRWVGNLTGHETQPSFLGVVTASQTIVKGDPLTISSGVWSIATGTSGTVDGIALEDATTGGVETANILICPTFPWCMFEAQCSGSYASTMVGAVVDIEGSTGAFLVNENATTEQVFQILKRTGDTIDGNYARVIGVFVRSAFIPHLAAIG